MRPRRFQSSAGAQQKKADRPIEEVGHKVAESYEPCRFIGKSRFFWVQLQRVYVSGLGVVSSVGLGRQQFWQSLCEGRSGASEVSLFDTEAMDRHVACEVRGFQRRDFLSAAEARHAGRCASFAIAAARLAVEDAGLSAAALQTDRCAVVMGTTMGEANVLGELEAAWFHDGEAAVSASKVARYGSTLLPIHVARALGTLGPVQTLPAACAAGNYAIAYAADQIRLGQLDVVVSGASEVLEKLQFAGFVRLGAMAPERCQPFDKQRRGLLLGEGGAALILESEDHLRRRGGRPLAEVGGCGLACDAHHITRPHPDGVGSYAAMLDAIERSGITPADVDHINAHGTGTHANDLVETKVIQQVFGARRLPVTSIKSMLGHCMGAASALEAVACVLSIETGVYPPTMNLEERDPECDLNIVANRPQAGSVDVILNNALAFGGYDAVVCLAKPGVLPPPALPPLVATPAVLSSGPGASPVGLGGGLR